MIMKIQPITNFASYKNNAASYNTKQHSQVSQNYTSIYSSGMSKLAFGSVVPLKTAFTKEIAEQPKVLKNIINKFFAEKGKISGIDINWSKQEIEKASAINIVASGSSKNAGEMAKTFMENVVDIPVNIMSASEFITSKPKLNKNDIMLFISQSGNTADTFDALAYSQSRGLKTIAVTNNANSRIHKAADVSVDMQAGTENAVAATKTVTSSVVNLFGIGMKLGEIKQTFLPSSKTGQKYIEAMKALPQNIERIIENTSQVDKIAAKTANKENFYFLAKEPNIGAVNEGALKLTETTQKRIISGSSSEYMHGLFTSIKPEDVFVEAAPNGNSYNLALENFMEIVKKRNVKNPILLKSESNKAVEEKLSNVDFIDIPDTAEELTPILTTVRFQQLTNSITKKLGIDPDNGGGILTKFRANLSM